MKDAEIPNDNADNAERMKVLRAALGISQTSFAALVGMTLPKIVNRERGISPWKSAEIVRAKSRVAEHIATVGNALAALDA